MRLLGNDSFGFPEAEKVHELFGLMMWVNLSIGELRQVEGDNAGDEPADDADTASPWQVTWETADAAGSVVLEVEAVDQADNTCTHSVTVTVGEGVAFEVVLTSPPADATVSGARLWAMLAAKAVSMMVLAASQ